MSELIVIEKKELKTLLRLVLREEMSKHLPKPDPIGVTYTRTQVCKLLGRGSRKINELINAGIIKVTRDGRITQGELDKYLDNS